MTPCSEPQCPDPVCARGLCLHHYRRWCRANPEEVQTHLRFPENLLRRLRFDPPTSMLTGCITFTGCTVDGYGTISVAGKMQKAHRMAWELARGPVPEGLELDHLCHGADDSCPGGASCPHRACCNPGHMEPVTKRENGVRGRRNVEKLARTHCLNGHEWTEENTYRWSDGARRCRLCQREASARWRAKRKAKRKAKVDG